MKSDLDSIESYAFDLPETLIAQKPAEPRDASRLLVVNRSSETWAHRFFRDLPGILDEQDFVIANNTRVLKARLLGNRLASEACGKTGKLGGKIEFLMLEELEPLVWEGMFHASAKHKPGVRFEIPTPDGRGLRGELIRGASDSPHGTVVARFDRDPVESGAGLIPLPPYIQRAEFGPALKQDETRYQTVFSKELGSAAAPTAGLHFTEQVMEKLRARGVSWEEITLHVGLGTFRPVKDPDIGRHQMHEERYEIAPEVADRITEAHRLGKRILAVGTTTVRTLESAWDTDTARLRSGRGRTSLFIRPGHYDFKVVNRLLTNFHLPKSTLLMLVCAFAGRGLIMAAYQDAVREKYRFFSYGDAMLII